MLTDAAEKVAAYSSESAEEEVFVVPIQDVCCRLLTYADVRCRKSGRIFIRVGRGGGVSSADTRPADSGTVVDPAFYVCAGQVCVLLTYADVC